jgi:hypothetical protein
LFFFVFLFFSSPHLQHRVAFDWSVVWSVSVVLLCLGVCSSDQTPHARSLNRHYLHNASICFVFNSSCILRSLWSKFLLFFLCFVQSSFVSLMWNWIGLTG